MLSEWIWRLERHLTLLLKESGTITASIAICCTLARSLPATCSWLTRWWEPEDRAWNRMNKKKTSFLINIQFYWLLTSYWQIELWPSSNAKSRRFSPRKTRRFSREKMMTRVRLAGRRRIYSARYPSGPLQSSRRAIEPSPLRQRLQRRLWYLI